MNERPQGGDDLPRSGGHSLLRGGLRVFGFADHGFTRGCPAPGGVLFDEGRGAAKSAKCHRLTPATRGAGNPIRKTRYRAPEVLLRIRRLMRSNGAGIVQ